MGDREGQIQVNILLKEENMPIKNSKPIADFFSESLLFIKVQIPSILGIPISLVYIYQFTAVIFHSSFQFICLMYT